MLSLFKSKTVWAGLLGAGVYLLNAPHIGVTEIGTALTSILGVAGVRDAWAKGGKL